MLLSYSAFVLGTIMWVYGELRLQVTAYRWGIWWLVGCMFVPGVDWLFLLLYWRAARKPFLLSLAGVLLTLLGTCLHHQPSRT